MSQFICHCNSSLEFSKNMYSVHWKSNCLRVVPFNESSPGQTTTVPAYKLLVHIYELSEFHMKNNNIHDLMTWLLFHLNRLFQNIPRTTHRISKEQTINSTHADFFLFSSGSGLLIAIYYYICYGNRPAADSLLKLIKSDVRVLSKSAYSLSIGPPLF